MKPKHLLAGFVLLIWLMQPGGLFAQRIVKEYRIRNLVSDVVLQKFQQVNPDVHIYDHHEGNRLILVGDSLQLQEAFSQLELLDVQQMMVTIEFMLVEYFHENDFEWGIDITQGTTGNFKDINYTAGAQGGDLSFGFNAVTKLTPSFQVNVRALVAEDRAKVMTNPHLVVESGSEAHLSIKDRRTVTLETATINGVTTTLQNIDAGIEMFITPVPTHDSLIHLSIDGTVSEFLPFSSAGEFLIEENRINTSVDVRDGETLIIGGLILEETNDLDGGIPVLKDIPLLGLLFKKKRKVTNYVERVMYITPYLHPIGNLSEYKNIRDMTPFEREVEEIIEEDPGFLRYENTKKSMRKNRRRNSGN
ncbi:MAG: type II and III secretion system protein [Phaeodactylibacter sp.]|nr:type II and III secretion system protein [Phaeodactylibacter sp.]MCB0613306.1 type II and III secretion system protein [Phaeodactylibacter sp.]